MAADDARYADHLNRFLDALATDSGHSSNGSLSSEHELTPTIQRVQSHDDAPAADPLFADHLLDALMRSAPPHDALVFPAASMLSVTPDALRASPSLAGLNQSRSGWIWRQFATAALLLLVVVGGLIGLGALRPRNAADLPILPAISGMPTVETGTMTEILIDVADVALPANHAQAYATITDLQPGVSVELDGMVGSMALRVEQGTVRIAHGDIERVLQAGESWNAPVTGDVVFENEGNDAVRIVEVGAMDTTVSSSPDSKPEGMFSETFGGSETYVITDATTFTGGTGRMILERLTLPPGVALAPFPQPTFSWVGLTTGRLGVTLDGDRLPFRWDSGEERTYGVSQSLPVIPLGTEVTLRNAEDVPMVLYRLKIEPDDGQGPSAATPPP